MMSNKTKSEYKSKKGEVKDADEITAIAVKQLQTSAKFKQPRMIDILENEDIYNYKLRPALQGRINIPFDGVIMVGFVDTLVAQVNKPPVIEYVDITGANLKGARKHNSAFEKDSGVIRLAMKDRALKKQAALSGRAIAKFYAESDPEYKPNFNIVDYLDFHCEPNGGGHLDNHYFNGQENIFRSKDQVKTAGESGWYDKDQVNKLIAFIDSPEHKQNNDEYRNKVNRYNTLGLDMESNNYVGGTLFNLVEWVTWYKGKQYHLFFEKDSGIWLRCVELAEDFGINKTPFISFASPQEDAFNFWNRGPADQIKPIGEGIRVNLNEIMNNNRKRNWDMKIVNNRMIPDINKLDWRQDGVVGANVAVGESIQNGIYSFQTPEISGALNLNTYLDNLAGEKLGVNSQTQGDASEDKVGIYKGNQLQISKRMKLISDSYEEFYQDLGLRYQWGLWDHADEEQMVKLISTDGIGWEKITKEDKDPEYAVKVVTSSVEMIESDADKKNKVQMLLSIETDPEQKALINLKAHVEEKYRSVGFNDEMIKKFMDNKADTTDELMSEAKKAIELILKKRDPGLNQSATTGYIQYVSDYILDNADDLTPEEVAKINEYFEAHVPIAMKNAERQQFTDELGMEELEDETLPANLPVDPNVR